MTLINCSRCGMVNRPHRCPRHRPSPTARGYDYAWTKVRAAWLLDNPDCIVCGEPATDVDHIRGQKAGIEGNLASYCHSHHAAKTVRCDGGFGRHRQQID